VFIDKFKYIPNHKRTKMSAISILNPKAEIARASHSLAINISAAKGLQEILKSNLGPKGTMKM
jgi:T-complex protein 1 subunit zeta